MEEKIETTKPKRLIFIDILRGLTITLMIIINYQKSAYPMIEHAEWIGFTMADTVFPTFIFIMGLSIPLSLWNKKFKESIFKIGSRSIKLWIIGFIINAFPFYIDWSTLRFTGVLHRLAIVYFINAVLFVSFYNPSPSSSKKNKMFYIGYILISLIIWLSITYGFNVNNWNSDCNDDVTWSPECGAEAYFDTLIFTKNRNYQNKYFDPEGTVSTVTASLTGFIGLMVGIDIKTKLMPQKENKNEFINFYFIISILMLFSTYLISPLIPISKPLWTPSFILLSSSISICCLFIIFYLIEIKSYKFKGLSIIITGLLSMGKNPLLIYFLSEIIASTLDSIPCGDTSLGGLLFKVLFSSWMPNQLDSLIWSLIWVVFYILLAYFFDVKKIYLKV